jgi:hypothetical protein
VGVVEAWLKRRAGQAERHGTDLGPKPRMALAASRTGVVCGGARLSPPFPCTPQTSWEIKTCVERAVLVQRKLGQECNIQYHKNTMVLTKP